MASRKLRSIKGRVMRLTRLDECGAPVVGTCAYIVSDGFVSVTLSAEEEAGEEYTQKNAWGDFCIAEKDGDRVKWINVAIEMCEVDPEVLDLVGGANPIVNAGETVGATFGREPNPNAFAIEVWTKKAGSDSCAEGGGNPEWGYFVVPNVANGKLEGDVVIENGPLTMSMAGEGLGASPSWAEGPYGDAPLGGPFPEDDLWGLAVTTAQPPSPTDGCQSLGMTAATGATAGAPGAWTPSGSDPPDTVAALSGGIPNPVVASPATVWTSGQYVQTGTAGAPGEAYWNGTAWVAGRKS